MLNYLLRRLLWSVVVFLAATLVTFLIFFATGSDPAARMAGKNATPADVLRTKHDLGLDRALPLQYGSFLKRLVVDRSLGYSYGNRRPVNGQVWDAAQVTISLVLGGAVFWLLLSFPSGLLAALRPRSFLDRTTMLGVLAGISAHPVWLGLLATYFFGYKLDLFPLSGYANPIHNPDPTGQEGLFQWAYHLFLPWCTFAILFAALYTRVIRAQVLESLNDDYVRTARAKGASEPRVIVRHVLRNALLPVTTMLGLDIAVALAGAVFTESVYGLPGLGKAAVDGIRQADLPVTLGVVVFATICVLVITLVVDMLYAIIDPRIRLE